MFWTTISSCRCCRGYPCDSATIGSPYHQVEINFRFLRCSLTHMLYHRYRMYSLAAETQIPAPLDCLQELALFPIPNDPAFYEYLNKATSTLRRLRLRSDPMIFNTITPILSHLTHLELAICGYSYEESFFATILSTCILLQSLRLEFKISSSLHIHSPHFRRHADSLPHLEDFGIHFAHIEGNDPDLFPAIRDFIRDRPRLLSLELVAPAYRYPLTSFNGKQIGIGSQAWDFLSSLPSLIRLYMIVPYGLAIQQAAALVPRSVRSLRLTGGVVQWFRNDVIEAV